MSGATITVLYPAGVNFNMNYYLSSHMPMVQKNMSSFGMTGWRVTQNSGESPYAVTCELYLESLPKFQEGMGNHGEEILGDVKNFSDKEPVLMPGEVTGKSS